MKNDAIRKVLLIEVHSLVAVATELYLFRHMRVTCRHIPPLHFETPKKGFTALEWK